MKSAPSFAKDDDPPLPKDGSKIGPGPKPIWGMSVKRSKAICRKLVGTHTCSLPWLHCGIASVGEILHAKAEVCGLEYVESEAAARNSPDDEALSGRSRARS